MSFSQRDQTILSDLEKAQVIHRDIKELLTFYQNLFRPMRSSQLAASGRQDLEKK
jgi:hypothetical protein